MTPKMKNPLKPKGYIDKIYTIDKKKAQIAFFLYDYRNPATCADISKGTGIYIQLIKYHLPTMITKGWVLKIEDKNKNRYMLQPFFYDEGIMDTVIESLVPIVEFINNDQFEENQYDIPRKDAIMSCMQLLMHFVELEIVKLSQD